MLPRSFPCFAFSSTNLNLSTTYGQCWESTRNTIFWWGRLNGGSGFFRSRMAEHQKWGCTNLECTTIGPRDLSQAKCIVVHEQITKEIEERKYLNECTPFGYVACGYDLTAVCGFYIPSFDYVMAAQSVFRNNNLPYQAAIKDERAWYKIKPCVASQRHRPTKGWPAVKLAVVPKIGISLSLFSLWSRRYSKRLRKILNLGTTASLPVALCILCQQSSWY